MNVFLLSGIFHVVGQWSLGNGERPFYSLFFFLINGVGILLEEAWERATGRKIGGMVGWLWTFAWVLWWGNWFIEGYAFNGLINLGAKPGERPAELLLSLF